MTYSPTYTARAATSPEIVKFRGNGNSSKLFAIFDIPAVVFTARVSATPSTHDMIISIDYDTVSAGAITDCLYGMTVLISTALPATPSNIVGITYIRKVTTGSPILVGESSSFLPTAGQYLTVLDEYGPWQDHIRCNASGAVFVRADTAYSDQHTNFDPTPIIGSDRAARLSGATVTLNFAAASYVIDGSTIASHAWTFVGASATTGTTTATPTATYNATGRYKVKYTVTATNGKSRTTWRDVYIYDDTHLITIDPAVDSMSWDYESGGFEFSMTVLQDSTLSNVRDRAKVLLVEESYYNAQAGSIGPLAGSENIVAIGWLDDETVTLDVNRGEIRFTAKTAHYWLDQEDAFIVGYQNTTGTPSAWTQLHNLTPDLAAWDALAWRSTVMNFCDVQFTGDTRIATELTAPAGSLWSQLNYILQNSIFAKPTCDNYSRIFTEIDSQLIPVADRSSFPVVMTLTKDDYTEAEIQRVTVTKTSRINLSGVSINSSGTGAAFFSLADGHIFERYGKSESLEKLLLASQTQSNQLAADYKARANKEFTISIKGLTNNKLIGVCPHQYLSIALVAADTLRNIAYSGHIIPRHIDWEHDPETGVWTTNLDCDPETSGDLSVNGDIPVYDTDLPPITIPPIPPIPPLPPLPPPPPPIEPAPLDMLVILIPGYGLYYCDSADGTYTWYSLNGPFLTSEYQNFNIFDLGPTGVVYVSTYDKLFSVQLETYYRYYLGGPLLVFNTLFTVDADFGITAMAANKDGDGAGVFVVGNPNRADGGYITTPLGPVVNKYYQAHPSQGDSGAGQASLSYYDGKFYQAGTWGTNLNFFTALRRYSVELSLENAFDPVALNHNRGIAYVHATEADVQYWQPGDTIGRFTALGTAVDLIVGVKVVYNKHQQIACDPTGVIVWILDDVNSNGLDQAIKQSIDSGVTWTSITSPSGTITNGTLLNMGSALDWLICYNDLSAAPAPTLKIYRTTDGGTTWINALGNLFSVGVPTNGSVKMVRYA